MARNSVIKIAIHDEGFVAIIRKDRHNLWRIKNINTVRRYFRFYAVFDMLSLVTSDETNSHTYVYEVKEPYVKN